MGFLDRLRRSGARRDAPSERMLIVPTPDTDEPPTGPHRLADDRELSLIVVADDDGRAVLPAFTTEEALLRWNPAGSRYVALPESALVEMLAESDWDRMVVDGADPDAVVITRAEAARHVASYTVPAGTTMLLGQPADAPPDGLLRALREACEREPAVSEAHVYQVAIPERDEPAAPDGRPPSRPRC